MGRLSQIYCFLNAEKAPTKAEIVLDAHVKLGEMLKEDR